MAQYRNAVRIIGGTYRHRWLRFPQYDNLRPTLNRTRETLFNWLGQSLDAKCGLDLFAGSGALGFEAASRGASRVVMVENNSRILQSLRANQKLLDAKMVEIVAGDAIRYLSQCQEHFDVIFLDPPFSDDVLPELLSDMHRHLTPGGRVYIEAICLPSNLDAWHILRRGKSGQSAYALLGRKAVA